MSDLNFWPQTRQVIASGEIDFFTGTAGSQLFESLAGTVADVSAGAPANALFTFSMTDGRSTGATLLFERYEDRI